MKRIGLFVDVSNLYYCVSSKYNKKLDYSKLLNYIKDLGKIEAAVAYGAQMNNEANNFIKCIKEYGYDIRYKEPKSYEKKRKADWDVGITVEVMTRSDEFDMVVLGTADGDFIPLVEHLLRQNKNVVVLASGISRELAEIATKAIEIPESLLEK